MNRGEQARHDEHKKRVSQLREDMHKKIAYYSQKPVVSPEQLYHLVKEFFLSLLEKEYQPTYEELIEELHNLEHEFLFFTPHQRESVARILEKLSESHYSNAEMTPEQSAQILAEFKEVITDLTTHTEGSVDHILQLALKAISKNEYDRAKELYLQARELVEKMDGAHRQQYFPELNQIYSALS